MILLVTGLFGAIADALLSDSLGKDSMLVGGGQYWQYIIYYWWLHLSALGLARIL